MWMNIFYVYLTLPLKFGRETERQENRRHEIVSKPRSVGGKLALLLMLTVTNNDAQ